MKKVRNEKLQKLASLRKQAEASVEEKTTESRLSVVADRKEILMRTSITLRNNDQEAIQKILTFFYKKGLNK